MKKLILIGLACLFLGGCVEVKRETKNNSYEVDAAIAFIKSSKSDEWEIAQIIDSKWNNTQTHKPVWFKLIKRGEPWKWTCGTIWVEWNGKVAHNGMITDEWKPQEV